MTVERLLELIGERHSKSSDYLFASSTGITSWELPIINIEIKEVSRKELWKYTRIDFSSSNDKTIALVMQMGTEKTKKSDAITIREVKHKLKEIDRNLPVVCRYTDGMYTDVLNFFNGYNYDCREDWTRQEFGDAIYVLFV